MPETTASAERKDTGETFLVPIRQGNAGLVVAGHVLALILLTVLFAVACFLVVLSLAIVIDGGFDVAVGLLVLAAIGTAVLLARAALKSAGTLLLIRGWTGAVLSADEKGIGYTSRAGAASMKWSDVDGVTVGETRGFRCLIVAPGAPLVHPWFKDRPWLATLTERGGKDRDYFILPLRMLDIRQDVLVTALKKYADDRWADEPEPDDAA